MEAEKFHDRIKQIIDGNTSKLVLFPTMKCGKHYFGQEIVNFIKVTVDNDCNPTSFGCTAIIHPNQWVLLLDKNCNDLSVPGCGENAVGVVTVLAVATFC